MFLLSVSKLVDASWSLKWPSGAYLLEHKQHKYFLYVPL